MNLHNNCTFGGMTIEGTSLPNGTYTYAQLTSGPYYFANFVAGGSGSITIAAPVPPPAPTGLAAVTGDTQETITWLPANSATNYIISRSTQYGGPYTVIGSTSDLSYTDLWLTDGTLYYYVVSAQNPSGSSPNSAQVVGRPSLPVTGLATVVSNNIVKLSWDPFSGVTGYTVERGTRSGGPYTAIATGVTGTTYTDNSVQSGAVYYYAVVGAFYGGFSTALSREASAVTSLAAPNLTASLYGTNGIRLALSTTDAVLPQYLVEISSGRFFGSLTNLPAGNDPLSGVSASAYVVTNLNPGTTYFFRAMATNATGSSVYSAVVSSTVPTFAACVAFGTASSAVPAGFLHDNGAAYGDQGNGFTYGWSQYDWPQDISYNAMFRGGNLDLSWAGFIMQQKNLSGPPYPTWSIVIPNGLYTVHLVSGDTQASDSVFQQDVNGVDTTIVRPSSGGLNGFAEWTIDCSVTNQMLTLSTTANASNDKINRIDIYPLKVASPLLVNRSYQGTSFSAAFQTQSGVQYTILSATNLYPPVAWTPLTTITGNGSMTNFTDTGVAGSRARYYRISAVTP
jgi:fibronectin type 3 domain-containing protein